MREARPSLAAFVVRGLLYALAITALVLYAPTEQHVFIYQGFCRRRPWGFLPCGASAHAAWNEVAEPVHTRVSRTRQRVAGATRGRRTVALQGVKWSTSTASSTERWRRRRCVARFQGANWLGALPGPPSCGE